MKGDYMYNKIERSANVFKSISRELDELDVIMTEGGMSEDECIFLYMKLKNAKARLKMLEKMAGKKIKEYENDQVVYLI